MLYRLSQDLAYGLTSPATIRSNLELYLLVRCARPNFVLETGVNRGWSSAAILRALEHNDRGRLVSIDLPNADPGGRVDADGMRDFSWVPQDRTGLEVPEHLRHRWTLRLGDARQMLEEYRGAGVDFFFHDSEHSYPHQAFEFGWALGILPRGGILASDDVDRSPAFDEFTRGLPRIHWANRGAARNTR